MAAPEKIIELVERFRRNRATYVKAGYNETQLRREFLDPFFHALGWDVDNAVGHAPSMQEVVHEFGQDVRGASKTADYAFRVGTQTKFFVEAKKPGVRLKDDAGPAYQIRSYAYSAKLPLSILTDFEEFAVYDGRVFPKESDAATVARVLYLTCEEYAARWDELAGVFGREAVWKGAFDDFAGKPPKAYLPVDKNFLRDMEEWRKLLATNVANRNKDRELDARDLNFAVQAVLDRIIFLRVCEDRGLEAEGRLKAAAAAGEGVYERLFELFREADARYNSGLFHFKKEKDRATPVDALTPGLAVDDKVLKAVVKGLYDRPYVFSVMSADILGQVYEQFLGKVIRVLPAGGAKVEDKPEVKKAGGVYYTPTYIVDYIVANTVGELLKKCRTPADAATLRILDPACGSGSFLLGAYHQFLEWHRDWYFKDGAAKHDGELVADGAAGLVTYRLTAAAKKRILLNNIYGVDIDPQAVEVTKLSLLLKALEDESAASLHAQQQLYRERALPDLGANVKCGNSLIGPDYFDGRLMPDDDERERVNPFDWQKEFPQVFAAGGFDAVIGNPPWGSLITPSEKVYLTAHYHNKKGEAESHLFFIEKATNLLKEYGLLGMITPNTWLAVLNSWEIRAFLLENCEVREITELTKYVFSNAPDVTPVMVFIRNTVNRQTTCRVRRPTVDKVTSRNFSSVYSEEDIPQKHWLDGASKSFNLGLTAGFLSVKRKVEENTVLLGDITGVLYGIKTGDNTKFLSRKKTKRHKAQALKTGEVKRYSITWKGYYLWWTPDLAGYRKTVIEVPKVVVQYIRKLSLKQRIIAAIDSVGVYYPLNNYSYITKQDKSGYDLLYVLGFLNSKTVNYFYANTFIDYNIKPTYLAKIPIPPIDFNDDADVARHDKMVALVTRMLELHKKKAAARTPNEQERLERGIKETDAAIDKLVYELYGLTEEEIKIIEGSN